LLLRVHSLDVDKEIMDERNTSILKRFVFFEVSQDMLQHVHTLKTWLKVKNFYFKMITFEKIQKL
jgi:hypothetical protein